MSYLVKQFISECTYLLENVFDDISNQLIRHGTISANDNDIKLFWKYVRFIKYKYAILKEDSFEIDSFNLNFEDFINSYTEPTPEEIEEYIIVNKTREENKLSKKPNRIVYIFSNGVEEKKFMVNNYTTIFTSIKNRLRYINNTLLNIYINTTDKPGV